MTEISRWLITCFRANKGSDPGAALYNAQSTVASDSTYMGKPLETFLDPILNIPWRELGAIHRAAQLDGKWHILIELGYPVEGLTSAYAVALETWMEDEIVLELKFRPPPSRALPGASNVIAIASGKGGVGKSTTAVNLAVALDRAGAKAGILDADIYGPSQGIMLGIREGQRPEIRNENQFVPIRSHGIEAISMSMLVTDKTPMVWRGPMASGALQQPVSYTHLRAHETREARV